jgi:hypothetical protein
MIHREFLGLYSTHSTYFYVYCVLKSHHTSQNGLINAIE